jgi:hypothetical protein
MEKPIVEKTEVVIAGRTVVLDPDRMKFNEATLSDYMADEYGWIDYFGKQLEYATKEMAIAEGRYEALYNQKFVESKDGGGSDNYAKAKAASNPDVIQAYENKVERKLVVGLLRAHLRAWDKNHDNAQNRGHTLRKEMDKLNRDIYAEQDYGTTCNFEDTLRT